jgi:hypothetical protein
MHTPRTNQSPSYRLLVVLVTASVVLSGLALPVAAQDAEPNGSPALASSVTLGQAFPGTLSGASDGDYYEVTADRGQHVVAALTRPSSESGSVVVRVSRDGASFGGDSSVALPGSTVYAGATARADGRFLVLVEGIGTSASGDYTLTVDVVDSDPAESEPNDDRPAAAGFETIDGTEFSAVLYPGDVDTYAVPAVRGDRIDVRASTDERALVRLFRGDEFGPLGSAIASEFGDATIGTTVLGDDTYYVVVSRSVDDVETVPYTVTASVTTPDPNEPNDLPVDAGFVQPGETVRGLASIDDLDLFRVNASAGDSVAATLVLLDDNGENGRIRLALLEPGTTTVFTSGIDGEDVTAAGQSAFAAGTALEDGEYLVGVTGAIIGSLAGNYTLTVEVRPGDETEPNDERDVATPLLPNPVSPAIETDVGEGEDVDVYGFDGESGQSLSVTLTRIVDAGGSLSADLARGSQLTLVDSVSLNDPGAGSFDVALPADGTYYLEVQTVLGDAREPYRLEVALDGEPIALANDRFEPNDRAQDAADLTLGQEETDLRVVDDDVDLFAVELSEGDAFRGRLTFDVAGNETAAFALVDDAGATLAAGVPSAEGQRVTYLVPADDTYYLRVTGDGAGVANYTVLARVATRVTMLFEPADPVVVPGENATLDVSLVGADAGLADYAFTVESADAATVRVLDVTPVGATQSTNVTITTDGSSATVFVTGAAASVDENGTAVARVALGTSAAVDGVTVPVSVRDAVATDADGRDYDVATSTVGVQVRSRPVGPGDVTGRGDALDADADGLYEDVNGDGVATLDDVFDLAFEVLPRAAADPELVPFFDFDADGDVDLDDVFELAFR